MKENCEKGQRFLDVLDLEPFCQREGAGRVEERKVVCGEWLYWEGLGVGCIDCKTVS